ncbi:MAG: hypothetical protein K2N89_15025 [Lachnospiraceae bacterium]|nr:hypothetical protein [Lachnospiraceae bacterium]
MKRCLIISFSLCSILLYGCGSASDSSQNENPKVEETVIVQQMTDAYADGNDVTDEISTDVDDDIDNMGLPYNGAYDDDMGFNLDGVDYHFPVTPNDILACGSYEAFKDSFGDSIDSLDDICEPGRDDSTMRIIIRPKGKDYGPGIKVWLVNRTDGPLKAGDCEICSIDETGVDKLTMPDPYEAYPGKLTNLDGYGFFTCTKSDILQAYGTPDVATDGMLVYSKTAENGVRYTERFDFYTAPGGEYFGKCSAVEMQLNFPRE